MRGRAAAATLAILAIATTMTLVLRVPAIDGFGGVTAPSPVLIVAEATAPDALAARIEKWLQGRRSVAWVLSESTRPWLTFEGTNAPAIEVRRGPRPSSPPDPLDRFLRPHEGARAMLVGLSQDGRWSESDEEALQRMAGAVPGSTVAAVGVPTLRLATVARTRADLRLLVPLLAIVSLLLPAAFFGSLRAALFPLAVAGASCASTLVTMVVVKGAVDPIAVAIVPTVWAIATLDAVHLYGRASRTGDARQAARELWRPCLVTSGTTIVGLLALAFGDFVDAVSALGRWGALGTALAFLLTFVPGPALLAVGAPIRRGHARVETCFRRLLAFSQRRAGAVLAVWAIALGLTGAAAGQLETDVLYPYVYDAETRPARALETARTTLGIDPAPIHVALEARPAEERSPRVLAGVATVLQEWLDGDARVAVGLGAGLALRDVARREGVRTVSGGKPLGELAPWWDAESAKLRLTVLLRPMSYAQRRRFLRDLEALLAERFPGFEARVEGVPARLIAATEDAATGTLAALLATLLVALACFAMVLRRRSRRLLVVVAVVNVAPLVVLVGLAAGALALPFTVGVAGVATLVLALGVDDTVHLLWAARDPRVPLSTALADGARRAGAPVMLTTALLAGSFAVLALGSFVLHQRLAILVPLGVGLAWLADATLLPALVRVTRAR